MEFTASDGEVIFEDRILKILSANVKILKYNDHVHVLLWEREFLEWFLDKDMGYKQFIHLHEDITQEDLKQLEQLIDYLEL